MKNRPDLDSAMYGTVRETAVIPKQVISMKPVDTIGGVQIRQLQVADTPPVAAVTPVNIQRLNLGNGQMKYFVQFIRDPTVTNYASTSVLLKTPNGVTALQSQGNEGPITFTTAQTTAPASVALQTDTTTGTATSTDFGTGTSNRINRT